MRLRRLDLTRFGHFTDFSLDFGVREEGRPDLHIVFGPNEAGKTTAFEGYLDLLFGIPGRSKYNFLHEYENMRVGGALELDGNPVELVRIKRNKGDLITPSGDPANLAQLSHALDGIDREQYCAMFSLDDETIEAGGEDILASQGNLGELLFSAAAGLSDLGAVLEAARGEVDQFHKARARKTELAEAKRKLQELHAQIRELDVPASAFRRLKDERDSAAKLLSQAKQARDALLEQQAHLEAAVECLPLLQTLKDGDKELSAYIGYPSLPDGAEKEAQDLKSRHVEAATRLRHATIQKEKEEQARDALILDPVIENIADELTVLLDAAKSRAQTAEEDLPKRETELDGLAAELSTLANELELDRPDDGALSETRLARLASICGDHAEATSKLADAQKEKADADEKVKSLEQSNYDQPSMPLIGDLEALLKDLAPEERLSQMKTAEANVSSAEQAFERAVEGLAPWQGDPKDIGRVSLSGSEAERLARDWADLREARQMARREVEDAQRDYDGVEARLNEFEKDDIAAVDDDVKAAREERDVLWENHTRSLSEDSAKAFHAALLRDDALQEARLGFAERLARLRELRVDAASFKATLSSRENSRSSMEERYKAERRKLSERLAVLDLPESFDPRDLPGWQARLVTAQDRKIDLDRKRDDAVEASRSVQEAASRLGAAMSIPDGTLGLPELVRKARAISADAAATRAKIEADKKRREDAEKEAARRADEVKRLSEQIGDLQASWDREAEDLPTALLSLGGFRWKLSALQKLGVKLAEREKLKRRIEAMEKDRDVFKDEIATLAERADEPVDAAPLVLGERLRRRLERAQKSETDLETLSAKVSAAAADIRSAQEDLAAIDERVHELAGAFESILSITFVDDLIEAQSQAAKADQLRNEVREVRERILKRLGVADIDAAEALLAGKDVLELEGRKAGLHADLKTAEADHEVKVGDLRSANDALEKVGGDNAPAQLEEKRQTLLLDLEEQARRALRLKLGILATEQALAVYRDDHRSKMLADTERAFQTLTGGRYQDLKTQADGQKEILLALRKRDSRSITVSEMSKGTRFQLYLALRLAGYRQYAAGGTTLPFVADDIMETFDNKRTAAALCLLSEISEQGQAIYFTHHEHVVDLAEEVCGGSMTVHELPIIN
jgi:uncharacterized protein YhaN